MRLQGQLGDSPIMGAAVNSGGGPYLDDLRANVRSNIIEQRERDIALDLGLRVQAAHRKGTMEGFDAVIDEVRAEHEARYELLLKGADQEAEGFRSRSFRR